MANHRFIGLMSGTSLDGVDACLVDFGSNSATMLGCHHRPFDPELRRLLVRLCQDSRIAPETLADAERQLCDRYADAVQQLLSSLSLSGTDVVAIGNHGQTIRHLPNQHFSWQIGNPARLAALCNLPVVADFRSGDMARGGQGAPLAPAFHAAFFGHPEECRLVVNLGGIANVSLLRPNHAPVGWDTGPANTLLDAWYQRHHETANWDPEGQWAASGESRAELLERLLGDPYFQQAPPKSTGPEHFNLAWLAQHAPAAMNEMGAADVQATLVELSVQPIAAIARANRVDRVIACGGGTHNRTLMTRLQHDLGNVPLESSQVHGLDPDHVESAGFAWLAQQRWCQQAVPLTAVTGADRDGILGGLWLP